MSSRVQKDIVCDSLSANTAVSQLSQTQAADLLVTLTNSSLFPVNYYNTTSITLTTGSTFSSDYIGVLAPSGKIYGISSATQNVGILDPVQKTFDTTSVSIVSGSTFNVFNGVFGGVLAPNGKMYCIPSNMRAVCVIDPDTNTYDTTLVSLTTGSTFSQPVRNWFGNVLAPNGKIYGIPWRGSSVAVLDPATNTMDTTSITLTTGSTFAPGVEKWGNGVLGMNGKIYCVPRNATYIGVIDPEAQTIDTTSISLTSGSTFFAGGSQWQGGALAPNGKIYLAPRDAGAVGVIDPVANTFDTTLVTTASGSTMYAGGGKWAGATLGMDGKIYGMPRADGSVLVIDPTTNVAYTNLITASSGSTFSASTKFISSCLAESGKIYGLPSDEKSVLEITPSFPILPPWMLAPEFNKF